LHGFSKLTDRTAPDQLRRIASQVQTLAAIGAALRLRQQSKEADPAVQTRLAAVMEAAIPHGLDGLDAQQVSDALVPGCISQRM